MKDPRIRTLAENLLNYSVELQANEKILIEARGLYSLELVKELVEVATQKGAIPLWYYNDENIFRKFLKHTNEKQMGVFTELHLNQMKEMDAYIGIRGSENSFELADMTDEQMLLLSNSFMKRVHIEQRVEHTKWCVLRFPNSAMAQLAETSQEQFEGFYFDVCNLDYSQLSKAMNPLKHLMEQTDEVHLKSPGTDLTFSIKGIPVIKCDGKKNIPDGEVYTAPVKDSINGTITYNTPSLYQGTVYEQIQFEFKQGKIVNAQCNFSEKLNAVLDTDEGARYVGEFAIGVNPFITKAMKDTLFDEKIWGSIHLTPGNSYDDAPNGNKSAVHWDLVLIQTPEFGGGEMYFDGKLVRKDGEFVIPEIKNVLNQDAFRVN